MFPLSLPMGIRMRRDIIDVYLPRESKRASGNPDRTPVTHIRGEEQLLPYHIQVLRGDIRKYVIDKINKPLLKAIIILANRLPPVTRDNCHIPNTQILFDIWDIFRECNRIRTDLVDAAFKILIYKHEVDPVYRFFLNMFLILAYKSNWDYSEKPIYPWKGVSDADIRI